jgi:hypothetical protein
MDTTTKGWEGERLVEKSCVVGDNWQANGPGKSKTFVGFYECDGIHSDLDCAQLYY